MCSMKRAALVILVGAALVAGNACAPKKAIRYSKRPVPKDAGIAVIIDVPEKIKNVVLTRFMETGFNLKAVAASDLYGMNAIYDIRDLKKVAYRSGGDSALISMEKTVSNIYKLHLYNYEINKAETLDEIKNRMNVQYLVIIELQDWEKVSWGRAIDLSTYEIVWLENYPTKYSDTIDTIIKYFIASMTKG